MKRVKLSKKVTGSYRRIDDKVIGNELYIALRELKSFYDSMKAGNDYAGQLDGIIKNLEKVKKSVKVFK